MKPQKALHLHLEEAKKKPNINHLYAMMEKYNGWWCGIDYIHGKGFSYPFSRQLREVPAWKNYRDLFAELKLTKSCRILSEAIIDGMDFYTMNGLFNRSKGNCHVENVKFHLHDVIEFDNLTKPFSERYDDVAILDLNGLPTDIKRVEILGLSGIKEDWMCKAKEIWTREGEGVILKQWDAPYMPDKRNSSMIKIKLEENYDLLCVDYFTSIGEKGNLAYNLMLRNKSGVEIPVVIAKFTQIAEFNRERPVGKVVQIKCMNKTPYGSYREGRFDCVRYDKNSYEID
jgi:hypothetical protein